jgi:hypothetical protein
VTKRSLLAGLLTAVVIAVAWSAWTWWPPILRYRLRHIDQRTDRVVLAYLDGKQPLGPSARALADLWEAKSSVSQHMPLPPAGQVVRIVDSTPAVLAGRMNDPRLKELVDSAIHLSAFWVEQRPPQVGRDST